MTNRISWIALVVAVITLIALVTSEVWCSHQHKSGFIMLKKVFDEFEMSKQYKKKMEAIQLARKGIMDSLELSLNAQVRAIKAGKEKDKDRMSQFELDKQYYMERRKQMREDNDAMIKQYNEEVIKQMNQYVKDYGEKNGYDLLFGADGSGVLMYSSNKLDVTEDVIRYINERYKGNGK